HCNRSELWRRIHAEYCDIVAIAAAVGDAEDRVADGEKSPFGQTAESAVDSIHAIVVDDDETISDSRREAKRDGKRGVIESHRTVYVELIVTDARCCAVQLDGESGGGVQRDITAAQNSRTGARAQHDRAKSPVA